MWCRRVSGSLDRTTHLWAWQQKWQRQILQVWHRFTASPSTQRSQVKPSPSPCKVSSSTSFRARWSTVKSFTPPGGKSTSVSQTGQRMLSSGGGGGGGGCGGGRGGSCSLRQDPSELESKSSLCELRSEKGSSCSRQEVQKVCKQGSILGAEKSLLQSGHQLLEGSLASVRTLDMLFSSSWILWVSDIFWKTRRNKCSLNLFLNTSLKNRT